MTDKNQRIKNTLLKTFEKRKSQVCRVYECKVQMNRLNRLQKEQLKMIFVEAKWFYNHCLSWSKKEGNSIFKLVSSKIKEVKHFDKNKNEIISELNYLGSSMKATIIKTMQSNIKTINSLLRKGLQKHSQYLKFKKDFNSICLNQYGITHKIIGDYSIKIQGVKKPLKISGLKQFIYNKDIEIANCHLIKKANNYYLKITTFIHKNKILNSKPQTTKEAIALDFGCENSFITSEEEKIDVKIKETEHLKRLQKKLSRQVKGSNNYYRTRILLQKEYQKLSNKKDDFSNKFVASLKKNYNTIIIQDEQIHNWHKTGHGKSIQYSVLGRVKSKLKALDNVIILDKFIPTTKFCTKCGQCHKMPQHIRTYKCKCGVNEDRDIHAAKNMLWIYKAIKMLNLVPVERREFKREEFLTAVKTIFNYSEDKLQRIQKSLEDCNVSFEADDTYVQHLFETLIHEDATSSE